MNDEARKVRTVYNSFGAKKRGGEKRQWSESSPGGSQGQFVSCLGWPWVECGERMGMRNWREFWRCRSAEEGPAAGRMLTPSPHGRSVSCHQFWKEARALAR